MNAHLLTREEDFARVIHSMHTIGVVGIKDGSRPDAPAYTIPLLLQQEGYEIIGINPQVPNALGAPTLPALAALDRAVDVLDVFRRSEAIPALTDELLALPAERRPRCVWLQSGIRHDESALRLAEAGIDVVQDACLGVLARRHRPRA